jgi:hypothetical protein
MYVRKNAFSTIIICLFMVLNCKKSEVQEANIDIPPSSIEYVNYVINPNGVALYKKAGDFKSKQLVVPRGESVEVFKEKYRDVESINLDGMEWTRVRYKGEVFFYFGTSYVYRDDLNFRQMEIVFPGDSAERFAVVQKPDSYLYESPLADSKKLEKLELFSILEILKESQPTEFDAMTDSYYLDEPIWLEVKTSSNKIGFVNLGVARYREKAEAEFAIKKKQILDRGFIQINRKTVINSESSSAQELKILRKQEFIPVYSSTMENKKRVYHFNFYLKTKKVLHIPNEFHQLSDEDAKKGRWIWDSERSAGFVAKDQGMYFSNRDYSKYTFENTNYKGDHTPLEILYVKLSQENEGYDFKDFQLKSISIYKEGISYYKAKIYKKYQRPERREEQDAKYFIFKKIDGKYELVSDGIDSLGATEFVDLDNDGIDEMIVMQGWRMVEYKSIFALQNGVYQGIPQMGHEHGFIIQGHRIYLRGRKTDENGNNGKDVMVEYKYSKGELIPINENL